MIKNILIFVVTWLVFYNLAHVFLGFDPTWTEIALVIVGVDLSRAMANHFSPPPK